MEPESADSVEFWASIALPVSSLIWFAIFSLWIGKKWRWWSSKVRPILYFHSPGHSLRSTEPVGSRCADWTANRFFDECNCTCISHPHMYPPNISRDDSFVTRLWHKKPASDFRFLFYILILIIGLVFSSVLSPWISSISPDNVTDPSSLITICPGVHYFVTVEITLSPKFIWKCWLVLNRLVLSTFIMS